MRATSHRDIPTSTGDQMVTRPRFSRSCHPPRDALPTAPALTMGPARKSPERINAPPAATPCETTAPVMSPAHASPLASAARVGYRLRGALAREPSRGRPSPREPPRLFIYAAFFARDGARDLARPAVQRTITARRPGCRRWPSMQRALWSKRWVVSSSQHPFVRSVAVVSSSQRPFAERRGRFEQSTYAVAERRGISTCQSEGTTGRNMMLMRGSARARFGMACCQVR